MEHKQLYSVILLCVIVLVTFKGIAMNFVADRVRKNDINATRLHDPVQDMLPNMKHLYWVGDAMVMLFVAFIVVYMYINGHTLSLLQIICAVLVAFVIKLLVNSVTILPDPSGMCKEKEGSLRKHIFGRCNELMPSGHMITAFAILFYSCGILSAKIWYAMCVYTGCMWFITIAAHNHYTIDTFVSLFVVAACAPLVKNLN